MFMAKLVLLSSFQTTSHVGFPEELSEDIYMFFKGVSRPRNREIMRIFHVMFLRLEPEAFLIVENLFYGVLVYKSIDIL